MGLKVEELEISSSSYETIKSKLEKTISYIYQAATPFSFLGIKKNGADKLLIKEINNGKPHRRIRRRGRSGSDIRYSAEMDKPEKP
ncbi:MAG: hypothetical protein ACLTAF_03690 [Blautia coccoides]